ncbi:MAG TPA: hypothetical protein PKZ53_18770 [Acidobacteriota bacterium]|nr:hypothetical protein [Acidobacteriota bacterium]HNH85225.1 hypothetical protein [Acidobacteriota bacterium]HNJ42539.1 hypothetical protein [Acidobacteriota bacterium]
MKPSYYSFSEKDSPLGTPASCRQLLEPQPIDAGRMPALPGNIYLKCYSKPLSCSTG